jgi:transposase
MQIDLNNLPSDTSILHKIVTDLVSHNLSLQGQMKSLQEQLKLLQAKRFGKSSEKLDKEIAEVEIKIEECESLSAVFDEKYEGNHKSKSIPKRQKLPENLERIDEVLNPNPICPECGGEDFRKIADDISESLEYIPSSFKVIRHIRPRCACINCEKIVPAYPASKPIAKGMAGPGLLAHILVQKYCNHLPFYRQSEIYAREDIDLSRSTMAAWAGNSAFLLEALIEEIRKSIFASSHIHGDDTTVKVLAPGLGKTKTGRIWTYVRDGRKYGDTTPASGLLFLQP